MFTVRGTFQFFVTRYDICWHLVLIVGPLTLFTAILLGLVYGYVWERRRAPIDGLLINSGYSSDVIYVDYPATSLILVASWSSSVAIPLVGSLMAMSSFITAADLIRSSERGYMMLLPSPSQLATMVNLLEAKKWPLVTWLNGYFRSKKARVPSRWSVEFLVTCQLAALGLSVAILAADTWLHVDTKSVTKDFLSSISDPSSAGPSFYYSRNLIGDCGDPTNICSVKDSDDQAKATWLDAIRDLILQQSVNTVINVTETSNRTFVLGPRLVDIKDIAAGHGLDNQTFEAETLGCSSACVIQNSTCKVDLEGGSDGNWTYTCPNGFNGSIQYPGWFAMGSWWQENVSYDEMSAHYEDEPVIELGVASFLENITVQPANTSSGTLSFLKESRQVEGDVALLVCNITFSRMHYRWVNSSTPIEVNVTGEGLQLAKVARAPLLAGYLTKNLDSDQQAAAWDRAGLSSGNISKAGLEEAFSDVASMLGLALLGGTFEPSPASKLWLANSTIVTQVGKAPLFTLVILNLWYAGYGVVLFVLGLFVLKNDADVTDIIAVQQLISVKGLAMAAVERHRENLSERDVDLRVGVEKVCTDNGESKWRFRVWEIPQQVEEEKSLLGSSEGRAEE